MPRLTARGTGKPDYSQEVVGRAPDQTIHTLPVSAEGKQMEIRISDVALGSMVIYGGSISITNLAGGSIGIFKNYFGSQTLFDYESISAGATITSSWVNISFFGKKTFTFHSSSQGTCYLDVAPISTSKYYEYWSERIGPGSLITASFEELFVAARARIYSGAGGSADCVFTGMVI